jgi:hypothetical protein
MKTTTTTTASKTTTTYTFKGIFIMATIALFSTLTNDALAQRTAVASMTIRATVVESASVIAENELRFAPATLAGDAYISEVNSGARFTFTGTTDAEVSISVSQVDSFFDEDGNSVVFTPKVSINNDVVVDSGNQFVRLRGTDTGHSGKASVWVEGQLESENNLNGRMVSGSYLVSAAYN